MLPAEPLALKAIGFVRSCFGGKFGAPRQPGLCPSAWGRLVFQPEFRSPEALRALDGFSHVWLIWHFHHTACRGWSHTVRPPRLGGDTRVGVFASRSTHRPNPLGLTLARLEGIETTARDGPVILLGGIDMADGTPVFDIKPHLPYAESPPDAHAGYAEKPIPCLEVATARQAAADFDALPARARDVVREALALDPRPAGARRGNPAEDRVHGVHLCGRNVRFRVTGDRCEILEITPADNAGDPEPPA